MPFFLPFLPSTHSVALCFSSILLTASTCPTLSQLTRPDRFTASRPEQLIFKRSTPISTSTTRGKSLLLEWVKHTQTCCNPCVPKLPTTFLNIPLILHSTHDITKQPFHNSSHTVIPPQPSHQFIVSTLRVENTYLWHLSIHFVAPEPPVLILLFRSSAYRQDSASQLIVATQT